MNLIDSAEAQHRQISPLYVARGRNNLFKPCVKNKPFTQWTNVNVHTTHIRLRPKTRAALYV